MPPAAFPALVAAGAGSGGLWVQLGGGPHRWGAGLGPGAGPCPKPKLA